MIYSAAAAQEKLVSSVSLLPLLLLLLRPPLLLAHRHRHRHKQGRSSSGQRQCQCRPSFVSAAVRWPRAQARAEATCWWRRHCKSDISRAAAAAAAKDNSIQFAGARRPARTWPQTGGKRGCWRTRPAAWIDLLSEQGGPSCVGGGGGRSQSLFSVRSARSRRAGIPVWLPATLARVPTAAAASVGRPMAQKSTAPFICCPSPSPSQSSLLFVICQNFLSAARSAPSPGSGQLQSARLGWRSGEKSKYEPSSGKSWQREREREIERLCC